MSLILGRWRMSDWGVMTIRTVAVALFFTSAMPAVAAAQGTPRFVAGGTLGINRSWDDESMLGTGLTTEGRVGINLTAKTQIEFAIARMGFERQFDSGVATDGRSVFAGLILKHDFTSGGTRPFVLAGYGLNHSRTHRRDPVLDQTHTSNDHGYLFGTGVVFVRNRWEAGPEARAYMFAIESDSSVAMVLSGGIRASVRF